MRILLLGEYSNVHNTLAKGLRTLGHEVVVASNGDFWKNYPRDIDLQRKTGKIGGISLWMKLMVNLNNFKNFDIVQLINPMFFELKAERLFWFYHFLRKHNKKVVMGAFGMDHYWVKTTREHLFMRYSDFNIGNQLRTDKDAICHVEDWMGTTKERLNKLIATDCDAIVAGLWESERAYSYEYKDKTCFIPYPIEISNEAKAADVGEKVKILIGINRSRNKYKGTDILLEGAQKVVSTHPDKASLQVVENVPFAEYEQLVAKADILLDQAYSYTPAMNALMALGKGVVVLGGGEEEPYALLDADTPRAVVNVEPNVQSVVEALTPLVTNKKMLQQLKRDAITYIKLNHDHIKVAQQYCNLYEKCSKTLFPCCLQQTKEASSLLRNL